MISLPWFPEQHKNEAKYVFVHTKAQQKNKKESESLPSLGSCASVDSQTIGEEIRKPKRKKKEIKKETSRSSRGQSPFALDKKLYNN